MAEAQKRGLPEYEEWGQAMLTTAVFAIVVTAPLGAIMINTLGTKWLEYDGDEPELLQKHGMVEPRRGWTAHGKKNFAADSGHDIEVPSDTAADGQLVSTNNAKTNAIVPQNFAQSEPEKIELQQLPNQEPDKDTKD